ncbi:MAG: ribonuclease Z [Thermoplasmatota archaeon]
MRLHFLGTGGSWPTKRRGSMSIAVISGPTAVLLDCGEGTQRQLINSSVSPMKIGAILISHLHGDHFLGVPGLVQTMALNNREDELYLFGPEGLIKAWESALSMCPFRCTFPIKVAELSGGEQFEFKGIEISCAHVDHSIPNLAFKLKERDRPGRFNRSRAIELGIPEGPLWGKLQRGERIEVEKDGKISEFGPEDVLGERRKGASIVYSGDTGPSAALIELARGADALVHEATYAADMEDLAKEVAHSTIGDAVKAAREAEVGKLFLVHSSPRYTKESRFDAYRKEALSGFPHVVIPEDMEEYEVNR